MRHKWSVEDDLVAFYLYRCGKNDAPLSFKEVCELLEISENSMRMRIANYRYLDVGKGLSHFSKQTKEVYEKYKDFSEEDLRKVGRNIIERRLTSRKL